MQSTFDILSSIDRYASNHRLPEIEPLCQSSLLWFKIRRLYEDQKKKKKLKEIENKPQTFTLARREPDRQKTYSAPYQKSLLSPQIQNNHLHFNQVLSLIKIMKVINCVTETKMLRQCLLRKISELKDPNDKLTAFTKTIYPPMFKKSGIEAYKQFERSMTEILVNGKLEGCNPEIAYKFVKSLMHIDEKTLELLSFLLDEITDPLVTQPLEELFQRYFPEQPNQDQIRYLSRISNDRAVEKVCDLYEKGLAYNLTILEKEAQAKLKRIPKSYDDRGKAMLSFVFFVAAHGGQIWADIIDWQKEASEQYRSYLKDKVKKIVENTQGERYILTILTKLTNIDHESELADIFFNHVLNIKQKDMLNTQIVRKFLASKLVYKLKLMKEKQIPFAQSGLSNIFNKNLIYTDVLLQLLENPNQSYSFYGYFLENNNQERILEDFLDCLAEKKKAKFKSFFIKMLNSGETLLSLANNKLLHYFRQKMDIDMCFFSIKEMVCRSPATYCLLFIIDWLTKFRKDQLGGPLRYALVKNLNIVLLRQDLQLSRQFLIDLTKLREKLSPEELMCLLADVPASRKEMIQNAVTLI